MVLWFGDGVVEGWELGRLGRWKWGGGGGDDGRDRGCMGNNKDGMRW